MTTGAVNLFDLAHQSLHTLSDELATYGLYVDPGLELRRGEGLLCYYSLPDGHIYLSAPDPERPRGKFELLIFWTFDNVNGVQPEAVELTHLDN